MHTCVDAGPIIHLEEISRREPWGLFDRILLPEPVADEVLRRPEAPGAALVEKPMFDRIGVGRKLRDMATVFAMRHEISFTDGAVIAIAQREDLALVLTDDLDLREAAKTEGLTPVGCIGLLLRAARARLLDHGSADEALTALLDWSSLFITPELIERAKTALWAR